MKFTRTVPLNLYRRHSRQAKNCLGSHAPDSRSYEAEELRKKALEVLKSCRLVSTASSNVSLSSNRAEKMEGGGSRAKSHARTDLALSRAISLQEISESRFFATNRLRLRSHQDIRLPLPVVTSDPRAVAPRVP